MLESMLIRPNSFGQLHTSVYLLTYSLNFVLQLQVEMRKNKLVNTGLIKSSIHTQQFILLQPLIKKYMKKNIHVIWKQTMNSVQNKSNQIKSIYCQATANHHQEIK